MLLKSEAMLWLRSEDRLLHVHIPVTVHQVCCFVQINYIFDLTNRVLSFREKGAPSQGKLWINWMPYHVLCAME